MGVQTTSRLVVLVHVALEKGYSAEGYIGIKSGSGDNGVDQSDHIRPPLDDVD